MRHHPVWATVIIAGNCLLLARESGLADPAGGPSRVSVTSREAILGTWRGEASHNHQTTTVGLRFERGDSASMTVLLDLPALHLRGYPLGPAVASDSSTEDGTVLCRLSAGPFELLLDRAAGSLRGNLPRALVPVHVIPMTLTRGEGLPPSSRPEPDAPRADPVWTFEAGATLWADLALADGIVYAGADDGVLHALDAGTGGQRWSFRTGGPIRARAEVDGTDLYIPSDDGYLYRLDAMTGKERWRTRIHPTPITRLPDSDPASRHDITASAPIAANGRVYLGTHDGRLLALDPASGATLWSQATGGSILAAPGFADGRIWAGSFSGEVTAFDAEDGTRLWAFDTRAPVTSTPVPCDGRVVVGSRSYDIFGLDADTGRPAWNRYVWFSWIESSAAIADGVAYIGSSDAATLFALEAATGQTRWEADTYGLSWGRPAIDGGRIFLGTRGTSAGVDHRAYAQARDLATGRLLWHHAIARPDSNAPYGFGGSAVAGDGRVFFGSIDGRVLAFEAAGPAAKK